MKRRSKGKGRERGGETVEQTRKNIHEISHEIDPSVMVKLMVGTGGLLDLLLRRSSEEACVIM